MLIQRCWDADCAKRPTFTEIVSILEEIHKLYPSIKKVSTWSETKINAFNLAASSTKKKRMTKVEQRRKFSKEIKETLLSDDELQLLLLSHNKS